jgi:signal transduction histidine kinase
LDDDWVEAGAQRSASYSRLSPGDYRFEVTACHQFGEWSTPAAALSIAVTPFVWQQWWFRIGAGGTLLAGVAASIRRWERKRVRQRVEYLERQHAIERERIRIARDIHDELGAGLTQIGLLADLGHGEAVAPEQVREHLEKIQTRARGAVTALDEIVWAVNPRNDNLTRLADYLCRVADDCFEAGVTRCRKEVPTNLPPRPVTAELRHNLILAVKEALTNALRHAGARTVWLRLTWSEPELVVTVEDDGCGFDPRQQTAQGNGLRHQALRMKDIGGEVEVESVSGRGARVRFRVVLDEPT